MKNILVATDFSATADNAVCYAVELAKATGASITLFHVFNLPIMATEASDEEFTTLDELEKESLLLLKKVQTNIALTTPEVNVDIDTRGGFVNDEIDKMGRGSRYELIVMGITGHGEALELFGNIATSVADCSKSPVLIIPFESKFKTPKKIIFAFDYQEIKESRHIHMMLDLAELFKAKVQVLNIAGDIQEGFTERELASIQVSDLLCNTKNSMSVPADKDPINGIDEYLKRNKGEMLVMIRRKHGFFDWLLHGSNTKKMAFHTSIPLLILHD